MLNKDVWQQFLVSDIFDIHPTKTYSLLTSEIINNQGNTPVLSSTGSNNGVAGYTNLEPTEQGNIITYSDTTGGTATMFYQSCPFVGCCHVQGLYPKIDSLLSVFNEEIALFLISVIQSALGFDWTYGNKLTRRKLQQSLIRLPVLSNGVPDWQLMKDYITQLKTNYLLKIREQLNITVFSSLCVDEFFHNNTDFREFFIRDLFIAQTGDVDLQQKDINNKGQYFINSGVKDTGIKGRTDKEAKIFPANTLTLDFLGNVFYRNYEYKLATHNHVFSLSGDIIVNEEVGLYLVASLQFLKHIYSFDNMCTWNKVKDFKIFLPVCKKDRNSFSEHYVPDIDYMKKYILYIKNKIMLEYRNTMYSGLTVLES